jgi:uncharacterized membrane protein
MGCSLAGLAKARSLNHFNSQRMHPNQFPATVGLHLRPALGTLEPPQRLRLMRVTFQKFFPCVWLAILLLLASGYWMLLTIFGGFTGAGLYVHLMQMIGWMMIALFVWLFHGPWLTFKRAVDAEDWPSAGAALNRIRQIIAVNLPLGLLVVVIGGSGHHWG